MTEASRILLLTFDAIGPRLGGAAIRVLGLARGLQALNFSPTIVASELENGAANESFPIDRFDLARAHETLQPFLENADVAVLPLHALKRLPFLRRAKIPLVFDIYDPVLFELMETGADVEAHLQLLKLVLRRGDFFLCASERQRDFWLGALTANGRLNVSELIGIVPFGIDPRPSPTHAIERTIFFQFPPGEKIIVWPGGIWDWTDPEALVKAMRILASHAPEIHLVFFAGTHPGADHIETVAARGARALAAGQTNVHFIDDYVPYEKRGCYFAECDAAVSTHRANLESHFAYRARFLDCIWAALPIVCTEGDAMAELVVRRGLGLVVPPENPEALARALKRIVTDTEFAATCRQHLGECRADFDWKDAVAPLARFCRQPHITHVATPVSDASMLIGSAWNVFRKHGLRETAQRLKQHLRGR